MKLIREFLRCNAFSSVSTSMLEVPELRERRGGQRNHRETVRNGDVMPRDCLWGGENAGTKWTSSTLKVDATDWAAAEVAIMDRIESSADDGNPHDPCSSALPESVAESFRNTCCFKSSRPSPVIEENSNHVQSVLSTPALQLFHFCRNRGVHLGGNHDRRLEWKGFVVLCKFGPNSAIFVNRILFAHGRDVHQDAAAGGSVRCDGGTASRVRGPRWAPSIKPGISATSQKARSALTETAPPDEVQGS